MTSNQKEEIERLRLSGMGCSKIAKELCLSENTVKSYCRRNSVACKSKNAQDKVDEDVHYCRCCGKPVKQMTGRKEKKFCSDACRIKWWNAHPEMGKNRNTRQCVCRHCGKKFIVPGSLRRKYCSHACYIEERFGDAHASQRF